MTPSELAQQINYWQEKIPIGAYFFIAAVWMFYWLWQVHVCQIMIMDYIDVPEISKNLGIMSAQYMGHAEAGFTAIISRWLGNTIEK